MKLFLPTFLFIFLVVACAPKNESNDGLSGIWRAELALDDDSLVLPFFIEFVDSANGLKAAIWNGKEMILQPDVMAMGDSLIIPSPYFNTTIVVKHNTNELNGYWIDSSRAGVYKLPFKAKYNLPHRFSFSEMTNSDIDGKWDVRFSPNTENEYPAIGLFTTDENSTQGTFITETGDYRFLEGGFGGGKLKLSTFDGSHAFLFLADLVNDTLKGIFYSGKHHQEPFVAWRNDSAQLHDPYTLTQLTSPNARLSFTAKDLEENQVVYPSARFENKALLVQIMGSWCPNCMDESAFLAPLKDDLEMRGVEIVALAFERQEFADVLPTLRRMKKNLGIKYPVLYAGKSSKKGAAEALPFLNEIISYPTLLFVKPNGEIFRIHTGFYGPGTGTYFDKQSNEMLDDIEKLIKLSFVD